MQENGFENVYRASTKADTFVLLKDNYFELVLLDINLSNTLDGFAIADYLNQNTKSSIIFLTSYSSKDIVERIMLANPIAYILKPINNTHLLASIEIAFSQKRPENSNEKNIKENSIKTEISVKNRDLFFKENTKYYTLPLNDILWIKSDKNYTEIITLNRRHIIRYSLAKFLEILPSDIFRKCHKSIIININHVDEYSKTEVLINAIVIPVSRQNKKELLLSLNQIRLKQSNEL